MIFGDLVLNSEDVFLGRSGDKRLGTAQSKDFLAQISDVSHKWSRENSFSNMVGVVSQTLGIHYKNFQKLY